MSCRSHDLYDEAPGKMACPDEACMAVIVEMHNTGDPALRTEVSAIIEHVLSGRPGDWRVSIVGSLENDRWEMKITGPNAFERSYTLEGAAGEHEPRRIGTLVARMLPAVG